MSQNLVEILRPVLSPIILEGFISYEKKYKKINTDLLRKKLKDSTLKLFLEIFNRLENNESVSISPFKQIITESILEIGVDEVYPIEIYDEVVAVLSKYAKNYSENYSIFLLKIKQYKEIITKFIINEDFFSSTVFDVLQTAPEYQYSEDKFIYSVKEVNNYSKTVYTLFPQSRYWEEFQSLSNTSSYSPLSYNRVASKIGKSEYRLSISYRDLIIYNGDLYKLNPDVGSPTRDFFESSQWSKYVSKRLNRAAKFKEVFEKNVRQYYNGFLENGFDINSVISDSKIEEYSDPTVVNEELLTVTFGGEGKSILQGINSLKIFSDYIGSYEGSIIGGIQYISKYSQYLFGAAYGRLNSDVFATINNESSFGKFDVLFAGATSLNKIPGLNFLNSFLKLKSFIHGQKVPDDTFIENKTLTYNSIYAQFKDGLKDRYTAEIKANSYTIPPSVDLLSSAINTLYSRCLYLGDLVQSMLSSLDLTGKLPGSEGLGSIEPQLKELQRVFPPSPYMESLREGPKPGMSGVIKFIKESYDQLYSTFIYTQLPGNPLEFLLKITAAVNDQINGIYESISRLSISSFEYIPNISNISFQGQNTVLISFLRSLGFSESEINKVISINNFSDLITSFAPISNSDDLKSFFKGFELSQLIYQIGGQDGIDAYLSFLYSVSDVDGLLNILSLAQKDPSKATYINISKYPRLIGLLIGLTYAIDPNQIIKFTKILGQNNLTLLESIAYLFQSGQENIIKSKDEINLLSGIIDQIIQGNYQDGLMSPSLDYAQTNSLAPIALKEWTEVIGDNLGNISSEKLINALYDKAVGLTPKELITLLGETSPTTALGQILDGFNGGNFTKFIQYANLTGLGIRLGTYKNSQQLNNFKLQSDPLQSNILTLLEGFESISKSLRIVENVLKSSLDYSSLTVLSNKFKALINSQNKSFDTLNQTVIDILSSSDDNPELAITAGNSPIVESPGIGNSRLPNRIPIVNSITPEQYRVLFNTPINNVNFTEVIKQSPEIIINNFFKISEENKLANLISNTYETGSNPNTQVVDTKAWSPSSEYETIPMSINIPKMEYMTPPLYKEAGEVPEIENSILGVSYIPKKEIMANLPQEILKVFDPIVSCQRFGGKECTDIYGNLADRCVPSINKSLYPEEYKTVPGTSVGSISVDRPLGSFLEFKPSESLVPTSSFSSPPAYVSLLENKINGFGEKGEPILKGISSTPIKFSYGGGEVSEFNNTEFAIIEGIKAKLEKSSEFDCATFKSPFEYQMCMNIVKCKKFATPSNGKYYLDFCPRTLSGGRLK